MAVTANPEDGRSCLVALTPSGGDELVRLTRIGLERFGLFVSDWKPAEVRTLAQLLEKLQASMTAVAARERPAASGRRWCSRGGRERRRATASRSRSWFGRPPQGSQPYLQVFRKSASRAPPGCSVTLTVRVGFAGTRIVYVPASSVMR